jgi:mannose-6-phosphate isomerase-like protein (cupin superfamily)
MDPMEAMTTANKDLSRLVVDLQALPGIECVCGIARRAFTHEPLSPSSFHVTDIVCDAQTHFHKIITEIYYFLECDAGAAMELDGNIVPVRTGFCVLIPPGVRHRAIGKMRVIVVATPRFDPADEWVDADRQIR